MAFQGFLKQSTAVDVLVGPFVDDGDGKTAETGLTLSQADVRLSKNGQNMAQKSDNTSCVHDELGMYNCELDATDTNTVGQLTISIHESGALPVRLDYHVVEEAVYDAMYGGTAAGPLQSTTAGRKLDVTANGEAGLDFGNTTGTIDAAQLGADCITAAKIADDAIAAEHIASNTIVAATLAADCITEAKIADDAIAAEHIAAGAIVAATLAADCITEAKIADDAIAAEHIAANTIVAATLASDCITAAKIADDAIAAEHIASNTIVAATLAADCITAAKIADDALVAANFATGCLTADAFAADALVAATFATGAFTADAFASNALVAGTFASSSLNGKGDWNTTTPPTVAAIVNEWESQSQADPTGFHVNVKEVNGTAQTANDNGADINDILVDTAVIGAAGAGLTDLGGMSSTMKAQINTEVDTAFTTQMPDSVAAHEAIPTREQALYMIVQILSEMSISSTTMTVKKPDGSTTLMTFTLSDATNPTSITRAT